MTRVFFAKITRIGEPGHVSGLARRLLERVVEQEKIELQDDIPLKVHFGEKGNVTFVRPEHFDGVIDFLQEKGIRSRFIETTALYGGHRYRKDLHLRTAAEHGFTRLPVFLADGEHGERFDEVEIAQKHYVRCKIASGFAPYRQLIVLAHFKGHGLSGFGGAIKQLSMGCAARGGKLEMHLGVRPRIKPKKCTQCGLCRKACAEDAIVAGDKWRIDPGRCIGCGGCVAVCPERAVTVFSLRGIVHAAFGNRFNEKLAEYALAAQLGRRNIYLNFLMDVTRGCDCVGRRMKPVIGDIGVLAATDPVAIDKACWDLVKKAGKKFRGHSTFAYAEQIGLGRAGYILDEI
jgi:hypothetical protein